MSIFLIILYLLLSVYFGFRRYWLRIEYIPLYEWSVSDWIALGVCALLWGPIISVNHPNFRYILLLWCLLIFTS